MNDAPTRSWRQPPETEAILAVGSGGLFAAVTWAILFNVVPPANEKYAMLMLGALIGVVKDTFGRYFQSTKGSQEQRKQADKVAETLAASTAAVAATAAGSSELSSAAPIGTPEDPVSVDVVKPEPEP